MISTGDISNRCGHPHNKGRAPVAWGIAIPIKPGLARPASVSLCPLHLANEMVYWPDFWTFEPIAAVQEKADDLMKRAAAWRRNRGSVKLPELVAW